MLNWRPIEMGYIFCNKMEYKLVMWRYNHSKCINHILILILFSFSFYPPWYIAKLDWLYKDLICAGWVVVHYYKNLATGNIWSCYKLLKIYILQNSICTDCWPTFNHYIYSVCNKNDFQNMNSYMNCITYLLR